MCSYGEYNACNFERNVENALESVRRVLSAEKRAVIAAKVHHQYDDKYLLAESLINTAIASQLHALSRLGLKQDVLKSIVEWSRSRSVTLECCVEERCSFNRKETKEVASKTKVVTEVTSSVETTEGVAESSWTSTEQVVNTVNEYFWSFEADFTLEAYLGVGDGTERVRIHESKIEEELVTTGESPPRQAKMKETVKRVELSWLLRHLDAGDFTPCFSIGRGAKGCATPLRNNDTADALEHFLNVHRWATTVMGYFERCGSRRCRESCRKASQAQFTFTPIVPLFREDGAEKTEEQSAELLNLDIIGVDDEETSAAVESQVAGESPSPLLAALEDGLSVEFPRDVRQQVREAFLRTYGDGNALTREEFQEALKSAVVMKERELEIVTADVYRGREPGEKASVNHVMEYFFPDSCRGPGGSSVLLPVDDANRLLGEERRSLGQLCKDLAGRFPVDAVATSMHIVLRHICNIAHQVRMSMLYIESMIRNQLYAAIGSHVTPADFAAYMRFHNRKLFREAYAPKPFCYCVRRTQRHAPDGVVSIEAVQDEDATTSMPEPIATMVTTQGSSHLMYFPLGASTRVQFRGERYLHAACLPKFSDEEEPNISLLARANQFCSMVVLIGRIASATMFDPMYAVIVQNKDEIRVPLQVSTIPTPKEFQDAIESLSKNQRNFAKAFRAMQLESTLFGVLVIQIKPQLERTLGLPEDSLTKELQLTQDLMELFQEYQVPSDLLCFDGDPGSSAREKVDSVRQNAISLQEVIKRNMQQHIKEEELKAKLELDRVREECERELEQERERCRLMIRKRREEQAAEERKRMESDFAIARMEEECCMMMPCVERSVERMACMEECGGMAPELLEFVQEDFQQEVPRDAQRDEEPEWSQQKNPEEKPSGEVGNSEGDEAVVDYTKVPKELEQRFKDLDEDNCLRPTIIEPIDVWERKFRKTPISEQSTETLFTDELIVERNKAFDLLDSLTRSGALVMEHAQLHVLITATHCFCKNVVDTVVEDNINPIDKVERSTLILASTIHRSTVSSLINGGETLTRIRNTSPALVYGVASGSGSQA
eukprot:TRINITY_DN19962_c0_g1_i1.p1 TRINITY_DN19962_c0_g1~~TRINITY_DN19962_c0_g1_i1.p1  ORF type:complete len:1064 (-),score=203.76 TRINITY_DN19962_c0_g1_i1:273-3464(-)